jgi:mRNA-degrading endonuclease toxin of MazEF toxin-antitoxin module
MAKDFDAWNGQKKKIDQRDQQIRYHEREVWWCWLGVNVGFEQDGSGEEYRRPVVIVTGLGPKTCLVVPLTTSPRAHRLRPSVGLVNGQEARALLSQIRVIDVRRLSQKLEYLPRDCFEKLKHAIREMI